MINKIFNFRFTIFKYRFDGKDIVKHPLFTGGSLMVGGGMAVNIINYIYHLVMGRILGPADYGVLASLFSILYVTSIVPVSTSFAIVKFISSAKTLTQKRIVYKSINSAVLVFALFATLGITFSSPLISSFLKIDNVWNVVLIGPVFLFTVITVVNQASLQGVLKFIGVVGPNFISGLSKLVVGVVLIFLGWSVFGAMIGILIGAIIAYYYSFRLAREFLGAKLGGQFNILSFLKYSLPVFLQALAFTSFFTTDVLLVKHFFPDFDAGIYAAVSTLGKVIFYAASPIAAVMFPIVAGRKSRGEDYTKILVASIGLTAAISACIVLIYLFFPNLAIGVLYGIKYLTASKYLIWMGIFIGFYNIAYILTNYFLSIGKTIVFSLPLFFSVVQIVAIWMYHSSILQVIQISLVLMLILCLSLGLYLVYDIHPALKSGVSSKGG